VRSTDKADGKSGAKNKPEDERSESGETTYPYSSRQTVTLMQQCYGYFSNETFFYCSYLFTIS